MNTAQKIYELVQDLPTLKQIEILDFAQYLAEKAKEKPKGSSSFDAFSGVLADSENFNDDPMVIQKMMRDEWD